MTARSRNEESLLRHITATFVQRSRRWVFTTVNVDAQDKYDIGNAVIYIGPIEKDVLGVSHRHGIICGKLLKSGRGASLEKLSLVRKLEALNIKTTYLASVKNVASYINYAFKEGMVPDELKALAKTSIHTNNQNYFEELACEVACEFEDKPNANVFKQKLLEKCFAYPQALLKRAYEQCKFGEESRLARKIRKKSASLEPKPFSAEKL